MDKNQTERALKNAVAKQNKQFARREAAIAKREAERVGIITVRLISRLRELRGK